MKAPHDVQSKASCVPRSESVREYLRLVSCCTVARQKVIHYPTTGPLLSLYSFSCPFSFFCTGKRSGGLFSFSQRSYTGSQLHAYAIEMFMTNEILHNADTACYI
ncbi:unnamed protein product [Periconia digitata]|uniref:Uncharacterized protein n=1 Tax=Periconia digitata TaxID=1303443 RepID=A0A9W4UEE4_9PLEO|nr:unnamed protein product [Periconia digitata]